MFRLFAKSKQKPLPQDLFSNNRYFDREINGEPFALGSEVCRVDHFMTPYYVYWIEKIKEKPRFHRKQWEFAYICHALFERGYLKRNMRGLGFGVGTEPLSDLFCSFGVSITATDQDFELNSAQGWAQSGQLSATKEDLYHEISEREVFSRNADFIRVDMNDIPSTLSDFDFNWSACSLEHLGSLKHGSDFVKNSMSTLKPGGLAVHTTEFNLSSDDETMETEGLSIFRKRDIVTLVDELRNDGHAVAPLNFYSGSHELDSYTDLPPYSQDPHLRLLLGKFKCTSIGLIIRRCE